MQHSRPSSQANSDCLAGDRAIHAFFLNASHKPDASSMSLQGHPAASADNAPVSAALSSSNRLSDAAAQHDCRSIDRKRTLYQLTSSNVRDGTLRKRAASADRPDHISNPARMTSYSKRKQAQLGTKGLTDLGQGAQVLYHPGMINHAEAAEMLTALQVMA